MAKMVFKQQESGEAKVSQWPREKAKGHLVKNVTTYCFLSKTIQLINLREICNISRMWQIFGAKIEKASRISRLILWSYGLTVNIDTFEKFSMCEISFSALVPFFMEFRCSM